MTTIKHKFGDIVFWLSSSGFRRGYVKSISFHSSKGKEELKYTLSCTAYHEEYMGDEVPEALIFADYQEMINYYQSITL